MWNLGLSPSLFSGGSFCTPPRAKSLNSLHLAHQLSQTASSQPAGHAGSDHGSAVPRSAGPVWPPSRRSPHSLIQANIIPTCLNLDCVRFFCDSNNIVANLLLLETTPVIELLSMKISFSCY